MTEHDKDYLTLTLLLLAVSVTMALMARRLRDHDEVLADVAPNVRYLMDNAVSRETEPRP